MKVNLTLLISLIYLSINAQVNQEYESYGLSDNVEELTMPIQDNERLKQAELRSRKKGRPDCFATSLKANINPHQNGTWDYTQNDIAVWRQKIISKGAKTLNLGFSNFYMPSGGKLYLIGKKENKVLGPFTPADNEEHRQLWTPVIEGDEMIVEIQIPISEIKNLDILLEHVNHDFIDILKSNSNSSSGSCNVDVICGADDGLPIIDSKRDIINSVGAYTLNGIEQCSGVLINNARNDCTPYFLTANHCEISNSNAASVVVYWNYENSVCREPETVESGNAGDGTFTQFTTGSKYIAGYAPSDFTLLLLDDEVSSDFTPFFAGWNVGRALPDSSVCVHHPNVEEKRISFDFDPNVLSVDAAEDTFVRVESWDLGTTERGSSGAPLFNNQDEIIGLLNSGQATCINNEYDDFGPMFLSWEGGGTPDTRLKDWLDPDNIGLISYPGKNCTFVLALSETVVEVCGDNTNTKTVDFSINEVFEGEVNISFDNLPDGLTVDFENNKLAPDSGSSFTLNNLSALNPDIYQIPFTADDGVNAVTSNLILKVFTTSGESVSITKPVNGSTGELTKLNLQWFTESDEVDLQLSADSDFTQIVENESGITNNNLSVEDLAPGTVYYWRVRAKNICGVGDWSSVSQFTTGQVFCSNSLQNSQTIIIPDTSSDTINSFIEVDISGEIRNVQISNISGKHTWVGDLSMNLISPSGTIVNLIDFICDDADDFSLGFSDEIGVSDIPCPLTDDRLYQPNGSLSALNGELAAGTWQLQIIDIATLDGGQLNNWGLEICTEISTEAIIYLGKNDINTCGATSISSSIGLGTGFDEDVTLTIDAPRVISAQLESNEIKNGSATKLLITNLDNTPSGSYEITVNATDGTNSKTEVITLQVSEPLESIELINPIDAAIDAPIMTELQWQQNSSDESYLLQVAISSDFSSIIIDTTLTVNQLSIAEGVFDELTEYFWRVAVSNGCNTIVSQTQSFTTDMGVSTFQLDDLSFEIYPNPASTFIKLISTNNLPRNLSISLYNINGQLILSDQIDAGGRVLDLNVSHLSSGLYFLKINDQEISHTEKMIINN